MSRTPPKCAHARSREGAQTHKRTNTHTHTHTHTHRRPSRNRFGSHPAQPQRAQLELSPTHPSHKPATASETVRHATLESAAVVGGRFHPTYPREQTPNTTAASSRMERNTATDRVAKAPGRAAPRALKALCSGLTSAKHGPLGGGTTARKRPNTYLKLAQKAL